LAVVAFAESAKGFVRGVVVAGSAVVSRLPVVLFAGVPGVPAVRAALRTGVVWEVVDRAFPQRGVGTLSVAFSAVVPAVVRVVESSARGRSWWSELMHLTSVGEHCSARSRGEERVPCKHAVTNP
jgi:hypothetical protein